MWQDYVVESYDGTTVYDRIGPEIPMFPGRYQANLFTMVYHYYSSVMRLSTDEAYEASEQYIKLHNIF